MSLPIHRARVLYQGYVLSSLLYGLEHIWYLLSDTLKQRLESIVRAGLRLLTGLSRFTKVDRLHDISGVYPLTALVVHPRPRFMACYRFKTRSSQVPYLRWKSGSALTNSFLNHISPSLSGSERCGRCLADVDSLFHYVFECSQLRLTSLRYRYSVCLLYTSDAADE